MYSHTFIKYSSMSSPNSLLTASEAMFNANNKEVANSILTNTLISTLKTGNSYIDTFTSLLTVSKFKNEWFKNACIVLVILIGNIVAKYSYELNSFDYHKTLKIYINKTTRREIYYISSKVPLKSSNIKDGKQQYILLSLLYNAIENNKDCMRLNLPGTKIIEYGNPFYTRFSYWAPCGYINHSVYDIDYKNIDSIMLKVLNVLLNPPAENVWYLIDKKNDVHVKYSINQGDSNFYSCCGRQEEYGNPCRNCNNNPEKGKKAKKGDFIYEYNVKSTKLTEKKLYKYIVDFKKTFINILFTTFRVQKHIYYFGKIGNLE